MLTDIFQTHAYKNYKIWVQTHNMLSTFEIVFKVLVEHFLFSLICTLKWCEILKVKPVSLICIDSPKLQWWKVNMQVGQWPNSPFLNRVCFLVQIKLNSLVFTFWRFHVLLIAGTLPLKINFILLEKAAKKVKAIKWSIILKFLRLIFSFLYASLSYFQWFLTFYLLKVVFLC